MKRLMLLIVVSLTVLSSTGAYACDHQVEHVIEIKGFEFVPATLKVEKGDKVTWVNKDSIAHNIVNRENQETLSQTLAKGDKFSFTVKQKMNYACGFHPSMLGSLQLMKPH